VRRHITWCLSLSLAPALGAQAQTRQPRVEISCPKPPTPVMVDGKHVLAYELHVTNFGRGALEFIEVDVRDAVKSAEAGQSFRDTALARLLQPVSQDGGEAARLDPGQRTVVYLWLATGSESPRRIMHRLVFANLDTAQARRDGGREASIEFEVASTGTAAPLLRAPLSGGEWVAGSGPSNSSDHRRSLAAVDAGAFISQRFAIDWVKVGPNGNTYQGDEHRNESYWAFGQPVVAVSDGEVVAAIDTIVDHAPHGSIPPVTLANIMGNHVILRIGPNQFATYAHLRHGSLRVRAHQHVRVGTVLGELGNTGQSTAPHLHFQVTDRPAILAAEGVPYVLRSFHFLGMASEFEESKHGDTPRTAELPAENMVIRLP